MDLDIGTWTNKIRSRNMKVITKQIKKRGMAYTNGRMDGNIEGISRMTIVTDMGSCSMRMGRWSTGVIGRMANRQKERNLT